MTQNHCFSLDYPNFNQLYIVFTVRFDLDNILVVLCIVLFLFVSKRIDCKDEKKNYIDNGMKSEKMCKFVCLSTEKRIEMYCHRLFDPYAGLI